MDLFKCKNRSHLMLSLFFSDEEAPWLNHLCRIRK